MSGLTGPTQGIDGERDRCNHEKEGGRRHCPPLGPLAMSTTPPLAHDGGFTLRWFRCAPDEPETAPEPLSSGRRSSSSRLTSRSNIAASFIDLVSRGLLSRLVDPRDGREGRWFRGFANESFGVLGEGIEENGTTSISDCFCSAVVDVCGGFPFPPRETA